MSKIKDNIAEIRNIAGLTDVDIEFIDAIEEEVTDLNEKVDDLQKQVTDIEDADELEASYDNTINAGIGVINWSSDNLQLIDVMERLEQQLKNTPPNNIVISRK